MIKASLAGTSLRASTDPEAVRLSPADVPEMIHLAARTGIGLFGARALVAMAGERVRPPGWTEISGVCTDAVHRGPWWGRQPTLTLSTQHCG